MRKNRFLMNLIAATAIGLAAIGCDSSSSGAIADTSDIAANNAANLAAQQNQLREYLIVAQRGINLPAANLGATQSTPTIDPANGPLNDIVTAPGDADVPRAELYEINGIGDTPIANNVITGPGGQTATQPTSNAGTTGAHGVYIDPSGNFVVTIGRTKNRGGANDTAILNAELQIHALRPQPLDQTFPPVIEFQAVQDPTPILIFTVNQGNFVSGAWSRDGRFFYASIEGRLITYAVDGTVGRLQQVQSLAFPAGAGGFNNAAELLASGNGAFIFAIDHANNNLLTYTRNTTTGLLTLAQTTAVSADPRGMTIDSTGQFLYLASRASQMLTGFRINANGTLTVVELFTGSGAVPFNLGTALGDVDANPQTTRLYVSSYAGVLQTYNINTATGGLSVAGANDDLLGNSRNTANLEIDPTGKFAFAVNEHDFEEFQAFAGENNVFANVNMANNDETMGGSRFSATAQQDQNGNDVFLLPIPTANAFTGDFQVARLNADGSVRFERSQTVQNPHGIDFLQKTFVR